VRKKNIKKTEIMIVSNDTNKIPEDKNDAERNARKCAKKNMIKKRHWLFWLKGKIFSFFDLFLFANILFDFKKLFTSFKRNKKLNFIIVFCQFYREWEEVNINKRKSFIVIVQSYFIISHNTWSDRKDSRHFRNIFLVPEKIITGHFFD
jgi:hypothetical protein